MSITNVEIKARCSDPGKFRNILKSENADFKGIDCQTDAYFKVPRGRLKLREGNIENSLIFYNRPDTAGPKQADVCFCQLKPGSGLKEVLINALDVLVTVSKKREIYLIGNIKFHIDTVQHLGSFIEIEAIDATGQIGRDKLLVQCQQYMELFGIVDDDLVDCSYSDMLIESRCNKGA